MSTLSASFRKIRSKQRIMVMTVKQRLFQQSRGHNSKINNLIWPVFNSSKISFISALSASFRKSQSKLKGYADDKHFPIISLWDFVVATETKFSLDLHKKLMLSIPPKGHATVRND